MLCGGGKNNKSKYWFPETVCIDAIGLNYASKELKKFLIPRDVDTVPSSSSSSSFKPILRASIQSNYWLKSRAGENEMPQTFKDFAMNRRNEPNLKHRVKLTNQIIYIAPIGSFSNGPSIELLSRFASIYFGLPVVVLDPFVIGTSKNTSSSVHAVVTEEKEKEKEQVIVKHPNLLSEEDIIITSRISYGAQQLLTTDILDILDLIKPSDALLVLGITMIDLYPKESWNFVMGEADQARKIGVFSFARYTVSIPEKSKEKEVKASTSHATCPRGGIEETKEIKEIKETKEEGKGKGGNNNKGTLFFNSCSVMIHELFHLFGVDHCQFYECIMRGSNSVEELIGHPLSLCPVCLHKLVFAVPSINVLQRYISLEKFCRSLLQETYGEVFKNYSTWLTQRIKSFCIK